MEKNPLPPTSATSTTSSTISSTATSSTSTLRFLHKSSHKISKPLASKPHFPTALPTNNSTNPAINPTNSASNSNNPHQPQPPVYNISKNDFRDVVQKLTGSPAHSSPAPPPPPPPPPQKPGSSRLQRIRPPPLADLAARPVAPAVRPAMLSPLPPFPTVSAAAESPITAYMRRLRGDATPVGFGGCLPSPGAMAAAAVSPTMLFPTSPGPVASPRWREI